MHGWLTQTLVVGLFLTAVVAGLFLGAWGSRPSRRQGFRCLLAALTVAAVCSSLPIGTFAAGDRGKHRHRSPAPPSTSAPVSTPATLPASSFFPKGTMRFSSTDYAA